MLLVTRLTPTCHLQADFVSCLSADHDNEVLGWIDTEAQVHS